MVKALILLKKCYVALTKLVMHWLSVLVLACQAKMTLCYNYPIMTPPPPQRFCGAFADFFAILHATTNYDGASFRLGDFAFNCDFGGVLLYCGQNRH